MTAIVRRLRRIRRDTDGSVAVEFALIGPIMLAMFFGVMQVGIGMQNYNALRSVSAELARHMVTDAQDAAARSDMTLRDDKPTLEAMAKDIAAAPPYGLERSRMTATVTPLPTEFDGASKREITLTYRARTYLNFIGFGTIPITYKSTVYIA